MNLNLSVVASAVPGDYSGNGIVDAADYVVWRKGLGTTYTQNDYNVWRAHFGSVVPLAGDYNGNGVVDAGDYVVWRKGLGTTYTQADYDIWRAHFGQTAGSGLGTIANAAVPEPTTSVLLMFAAVGWCLQRRRTK